jgi:hypothetical protein
MVDTLTQEQGPLIQKMNPKVKAKWLAALRSGEYEQTVGKLNDNHGGFCCLGVLCDIYTKEHENSGWRNYNEVACAFMENLEGDEEHPQNSQNSYPTPGVVKWSGIGGRDPHTNTLRFDDVKDPHSPLNPKAALSVLNDFKRYDFNQIADVIERDF